MRQVVFQALRDDLPVQPDSESALPDAELVRQHEEETQKFLLKRLPQNLSGWTSVEQQRLLKQLSANPRWSNGQWLNLRFLITAQQRDIEGLLSPTKGIFALWESENLSHPKSDDVFQECMKLAQAACKEQLEKFKKWQKMKKGRNPSLDPFKPAIASAVKKLVQAELPLSFQSLLFKKVRLHMSYVCESYNVHSSLVPSPSVCLPHQRTLSSRAMFMLFAACSRCTGQAEWHRLQTLR